MFISSKNEQKIWKIIIPIQVQYQMKHQYI